MAAAPEQVTIFTEANFGGNCRSIDYKGRDQKPNPYSIAYNFESKDKFYNNKSFSTCGFNSIMIGSGVVVTVCTEKFLRGTCKEFTESVGDLTEHGIAYGSINSFKIFTLNPKNYVQPGTPTANQVRICNTDKKSTTGCLTIGIGERSLKGMVYNQIEVGANVKAQVYPEPSWYGTSTLYPGGVKQKTSRFRSIRVLASEDNLRADRFRKGIPTPTPEITDSSITTADDDSSITTADDDSTIETTESSNSSSDEGNSPANIPVVMPEGGSFGKIRIGF